MINFQTHKYLIFLIPVIFFLGAKLYSVDRVYEKYLFKSTTGKEQFEIGEIRFKGNQFFKADVLTSILNSKQTDRSIAYGLFEFVYLKTKNNPLVPKFAKRVVESDLEYLETDIHFFSEESAELDLSIIKQGYSQYGFHDAKIDYRFFPDKNKRLNVLKFYLAEGKRYKIDTISYLGLDSLPDNIKQDIQKLRVIKSGDYFTEPLILAEVNTILYKLKNNGYYFASISEPQVVINPDSLTDKVSIRFSTGYRQRVGSIIVVDSLSGQKAISSTMARRQLTFKEGDYYEIDDIYNSEANFRLLNNFDYVKIDTFRIAPNDSILNIKVFLKYKKQEDYGFSAFMNRTYIDKALNAGIELSYTHKNFFGAAQNVNPFLRIAMLDVSRALYDMNNAEFEFQFGINISQPILWSWDNVRVGVSSQIMYSKRTLYEELRISTFTFPLKFNISLPSWTFFNGAVFEFSLDRQVPENYDLAISNAFSYAANAQDSIDIYKKFEQFSNLNRFVVGRNPIFTSTLIGATITGDKRNDPFSPTKGYYTSISIDGSPIPVNNITGMSNFARIQFNYSKYISWTNQTVFAYKFKAGHIFWFDKENSIIPYERQFFCGGANSVRGWPSRRLRYYGLSMKDKQESAYNDFAQDFIGNSSLFEGSFELRYKLAQKGSFNKFDQILESFGVAAFIDFGNAFQWTYLTKNGDYEVKMNLSDYIKGIAVAYGVGVRYDTPIGILRLDFGWKLYDPNSRIDPDIYSKSSSFDQFQFHIGLGNPF